MDAVSPGRKPGEDFEEVHLRTTGVGILQILPVGQENVHSRPRVRATASSTPFTNDAD